MCARLEVKPDCAKATMKLHFEIYKKIRLKPEYIDSIVESFLDNFPNGDNLWLFGSRVDLQAKGGDIDLYIETNIVDTRDVLKRKRNMVNSICKKLGEQRIDVVLNIRHENLELPIYKQALLSGVKLI